MPRTVFMGCLFVLLLPGHAVLAGPPEKVSGRMVMDEVAEGLRKYRKEAAPERRVWWLKRLAPIKDARVAVALGEAASSDDLEVSHRAIRLVFDHYDLMVPENSGASPIRGLVFQWWRMNEADLRRKAKQLP